MQIFKHLTANDVHIKPFPFQRELSMQAYLIENESILNLDTDTFSEAEILGCELSVINGGLNGDNNGRIDILASYSQEYLAIIELKLGQLNNDHLHQLEGYLQQKEKLYPNIQDKFVDQPKWIGVLVGSSITPELATTLRKGYTHNGIPIAALTIQRFRGDDGVVYVTTDTYRPENVKIGNRDLSKYTFEGKQYGKGQLVLAVIKWYVEKHPTINFAGLTQKFPVNLQGSYGVFTTSEKANEEYARNSRKRHFIEPDQLIQLSDAVIAVCKEWGLKSNNINRFIDKFNELAIADQLNTSIQRPVQP